MTAKKLPRTNRKASVRAEVLRLNRAWIKASLAMDLDFIDAFYDPRCRINFQNGTAVNKPWLMRLLRSGDIQFKSIANTEVKVECYDHMAIWTARASVTEIYKSNSVTGQYLWLRVFVPVGKTWRAVAFQSTTIPATT